MDLTPIVSSLSLLPGIIVGLKKVVSAFKEDPKIEQTASELEKGVVKIEGKLADIEEVARAIMAYLRISRDSSDLAASAKTALKMIEYPEIKERNAPIATKELRGVFIKGLNSHFEIDAKNIDSSDEGGFRGPFKSLSEEFSKTKVYLEKKDYPSLEGTIEEMDEIAAELAATANARTESLIVALERLTRGR